MQYIGKPTSSSWGGLWPVGESFIAIQTKKRAFYAVLATFGNFLSSVVTLVTITSNLSEIEERRRKNPTYPPPKKKFYIFEK